MYDSHKSHGDTHSLWYSRLSSDDEASLAGDGPLDAAELQVDVAIIGAGMAGLSVAYHVCQTGRSVAVIDKALIASGETGRTTAHLSNALDDHYTLLERVHGDIGAQLAAASHTAAIADIERIVSAEQIACDFTRVPGYLTSIHAEENAALRELREELNAARRAGLNVELVHDPGHAWAPGWSVRFEGQAQFQPLAYIVGLARAVRRRGARIFTNTRVLALDTSGARPRLALQGGRELTANDVIVATNTPIHERFAMHTKQAPYRTYVIGMQLASELEPALLWDTGDPYHYVRMADGVLVVGGEDHKVGQSQEPERAWDRLEEWTRARFPQAQALAWRWSGQVQEPFDGMAFIGADPSGHKHVYLATGDSGNGMTHGAIAGLLLTALIEGKAHPWARLYDPGRKPHNRALSEFARENANVAVHFAQGLALPAARRREPLAGEGVVVRRGLRPVAMYREPSGRTHACSAVCSHLGCIVQWNRAEQSWDCPCHGSRFDPYGRVLTGPALRDLTPLTQDHPAESQMPMQTLLNHLSHEFWQTETSAVQHCRREAERLGDIPPARALLACARHADEVLAELPKIAQRHGLKHSGVGLAVGKLFSEARDAFGDKLLTRERSYRGTLLGLRHGVDLVRLMHDTALHTSDDTLKVFLSTWLERREPLIEAAAQELRWFAERPERALERARGALFSNPFKLRQRTSS